MAYKNYTKPEELISKSFPTKLRGYSENEVKQYLKKIAKELEELYEELDGTRQSPSAVKEVKNTQDNNEIISSLSIETKKILQTAQESSNRIVNEAKENAEQILKEANTSKENIVNNAIEDANARAEQADANIAQAQLEVEAFIKELLADCDVARNNIISDYEKRKNILEAQCDSLRNQKNELLAQFKVIKDLLDASGQELTGINQEAQTQQNGSVGEQEEILYSEINVQNFIPELAETKDNKEIQVETDIEIEIESEKVFDFESEADAETETENVKGNVKEEVDESNVVEENIEEEVVEVEEPQVDEKELEVQNFAKDLSKIIKKVSRDEQNDLLQTLRTKKKTVLYKDVIPSRKDQASPYSVKCKTLFDKMTSSKTTTKQSNKWCEIILAPLYDKIISQAELADKESLDLSDNIASLYRLWRRDDIQALCEDVVIDCLNNK